MHTASAPTRTSGVLIATLAATTLLAALPAASGQAPTSVAQGTIKGTVKPPVANRRDVFRPTAYVARLDRPGAIMSVPVSARGAFRARVVPGLYAVVGSGHGRKAPDVDTDVVMVRPGRTVKARTVADKGPGRRDRAATVRVSIGRFTPPSGADADGRYFALGMRDLMISDLLQALSSTPSCSKDVRVYEDRKYGRFDDVLKELRLQTTRYFDETTRTAARRALRNLPKFAPTLRVMGSVSSLSETAASGTVRVVHVKSGRTVFSTRVSSTSPFDLSVAGGEAVAKFLCEADVATVPESIAGTFSGSVDTGTQRLTWSGTLTKTFVANDPFTGFPYTDAAHYRTTAATVSWQLTGRCAGSGTLTLADLDTEFYDTTVAWRPTDARGWAYELGLSPAYQTQAMKVPCPPTEDGPSPPYDAATLVGGGAGGRSSTTPTSAARSPTASARTRSRSTAA